MLAEFAGVVLAELFRRVDGLFPAVRALPRCFFYRAVNDLRPVWIHRPLTSLKRKRLKC
jgi:hypothetical protein